MIKIERQHLRTDKLNIFTIVSKSGDRNAKPEVIRLCDFFRANIVLFTTGFSLFAILWILLGKRCVYYFWGYGFSYGFRLRLKKFLISRCHLIVNHPKHLEKKATSKSSTVMPLWIDTKYLDSYVNSPAGDYFFIPGSNGRCFDLISGLARNNYDIRLATNKCVSDINFTCYENLPNDRFFELFSASRLVLLPLHDEGHLPGQTTALEAIYMGKRVLVSQCDTTDVLPSCVYKVISNDILNWERMISLSLNEPYLSSRQVDYDKVLRDTITFIVGCSD